MNQLAESPAALFAGITVGDKAGPPRISSEPTLCAVADILTAAAAVTVGDNSDAAIDGGPVEG